MSSSPKRVTEAQRALRELNFDNERANERSALTLLALLELGPRTPWRRAQNPRLRTVEIMESIRSRFGRNYKPNTRETIRRQTIHQFVEAGLIVLNPDDPKRAVNSPKTCYEVGPRALDLLRLVGTDQWSDALDIYLQEQPGLRDQYARARELEQLPVVLPEGGALTLTPGGQNVLIKAMVEEFCSRFTPGGEVLYVGDAGKDDPIFAEAELSKLGVRLDKHGKLPDLIVYLAERNWLVLMEAASSHGPVDAKRYGELRALFGDATADLVYVSCFPSRAEMRKYLADIAWETEVWCADAPDHLIHFNGEKFLGPYPSSA